MCGLRARTGHCSSSLGLLALRICECLRCLARFLGLLPLRCTHCSRCLRHLPRSLGLPLLGCLHRGLGLRGLAIGERLSGPRLRCVLRLSLLRGLDLRARLGRDLLRVGDLPRRLGLLRLRRCGKLLRLCHLPPSILLGGGGLRLFCASASGHHLRLLHFVVGLSLGLLGLHQLAVRGGRCLRGTGLHRLGLLHGEIGAPSGLLSLRCVPAVGGFGLFCLGLLCCGLSLDLVGLGRYEVGRLQCGPGLCLRGLRPRLSRPRPRHLLDRLLLRSLGMQTLVVSGRHSAGGLGTHAVRRGQFLVRQLLGSEELLLLPRIRGPLLLGSLFVDSGLRLHVGCLGLRLLSGPFQGFSPLELAVSSSLGGSCPCLLGPRGSRRRCHALVGGPLHGSGPLQLLPGPGPSGSCGGLSVLGFGQGLLLLL
mmetsp:Transcript_75602/g.208575  ORF Transcript_75602/g.208575 Transcript_75602/m.208575 type:complete len:421 (-) Transcript_75602:302-1564(-)